jgi:signal transduction histidine kinase
MLRRVFQNLIVNGLKFTREGVAPAIRVNADLLSDEWVIRVVDNGRGIDPGERANVFAMFARGESGADQTGSGMGLAISLRIIEHHGGRLWIEDGNEQGVTLCVALPAS